LEIVRVQDVGLARHDDPAVLEWPAAHSYILLTHDANSMTAHAYSRLRTGLYLPGVCVIPQSTPIRRAIDDLVIIALCSRQEDWDNQVRYLPL
jgi:hypothetical protein